MADEEIEVFGHRLRVRVEGPDQDRRYSAVIHEAGTDRPLTRTPVRGRSAAEARDRALEVAHNLLAIERLQQRIVAVARELAPGAEVELSEDARFVRADLVGGWDLAVPFAVPRDDVYDPGFDPDALEEDIRAHVTAHARRRT